MHIKAPEPLPRVLYNSIFLAGSIEQGKATNWQEYAANKLTAMGYTIFNPRRDNWDPTWDQSTDNPKFVEQVEWELNALDRAHNILFYFEPGTLSPVSMMELGLFVSGGRQTVVVACPDGFWRKGNIEIVCRKWGIDLFNTLEEAIDSFTPER